MKKFIQLFSLISFLILMTPAKASKIKGILDLVRRLASLQAESLGVQKNIFTQQQELNELMEEGNSYMKGHSGWGTYQFHDYQSYGDNAKEWSQVMEMSKHGQGSGELGKTITTISREFPAQNDAYNKGIQNTNNQNYYELKAKTILAIRAASQLDYNKVQSQIAYQQMLQKQIENTKDLKAAIDLSNRIQVEGNLITLEILRQTALTNQQQAVSEQASVNTALSNAKFLTKK